MVVVVAVVIVVWLRPHLHRHQWIVPEYIRTLDSTALDSTKRVFSLEDRPNVLSILYVI
jgi:hypothetical protein